MPTRRKKTAIRPSLISDRRLTRPTRSPTPSDRGVANRRSYPGASAEFAQTSATRAAANRTMPPAASRRKKACSGLTTTPKVEITTRTASAVLGGCPLSWLSDTRGQQYQDGARPAWSSALCPASAGRGGEGPLGATAGRVTEKRVPSSSREATLIDPPAASTIR